MALMPVSQVRQAFRNLQIVDLQLEFSHSFPPHQSPSRRHDGQFRLQKAEALLFHHAPTKARPISRKSSPQYLRNPNHNRVP
jgi:hypothetical protein